MITCKIYKCGGALAVDENVVTVEHALGFYDTFDWAAELLDAATAWKETPPRGGPPICMVLERDKQRVLDIAPSLAGDISIVVGATSPDGEETIGITRADLPEILLAFFDNNDLMVDKLLEGHTP